MNIQNAVSTAVKSQGLNSSFLDVAEELQLAFNVQTKNCVASAKRLAETHFKFAGAIARKYARYYRVEFDDLLQQGAIGLMNAVKGFRPDEFPGVRFATFAMRYIKGEIIQYILDNTRQFRIATTKAHRKLFFNIGRYRKGENLAFTAEQIKMIAEDLNVSEASVRSMEHKLFHADEEIDADEDDFIANQLSCEYSDPARIVEKAQYDERVINKINQVIKQFDDRTQEIIYHRLVAENKKPLRELAEQYNVSNERIRQIELRTVKAIREIVQEAA